MISSGFGLLACSITDPSSKNPQLRRSIAHLDSRPIAVGLEALSYRNVRAVIRYVKEIWTLGSEWPSALADARMMALQIPEARLESFWGCSITYTHMQAAFNAVDAVTGRAKRLGAINTIRRELDGTLTGDATDGEAAVEALKSAGFELRGKSAAIVGGVGGVGQAIVDAICAKGVHQLTLREHDPARLIAAQNLVQAHCGVALCDTI